MGLFGKRSTCLCCNNECYGRTYIVRKGKGVICSKCYERAGGESALNLSAVTVEEIRDIIAKKEQRALDRKNNSATGIVTAEEMFNYAMDKGYGKNCAKKRIIEGFKLIENNLFDNEHVYMTFIGMLNANLTDGDQAYVITNKRIIFTSYMSANRSAIKTVLLDNINDITLRPNGLLGEIMTIDTMKEVINVGLDKKAAKPIYSRVIEIIDELKNASNVIVNPVQNISGADEILKYKQLLDSGIITEEEFQNKKRQLLGL